MQFFEGLFIGGCRAQFGPVIKVLVRRGYTDQFLNLPVGFHFDAGGIADADHDRDPIGFLVVDGGKDAFFRCHGHGSLRSMRI